MILVFLAYIIGFMSLLTLDSRLYWRNVKYYFSFSIFLFIVYLFVSSSNLIFFFLLYELLLVPSFLFVYFISPSRRSIQASIYFIIWTQIGSFLVLCVITYIVSTFSCFEFSSLRFIKLTSFESFFIYFILFLGFGFKIPIWPFHYWLTKTHVEAPSGFSIYLSGFLVKSALYGFYKITNMLCFDVNSSFFLLICFIGVFDASLKMWGQTDLKKLAAYGTIQEMNLIYLILNWGDSNIIVSAILFTATHAFLSALMFFAVDCIYKRFNSRFLIDLSGILHLNPNLAIFIFFIIIFFAGLPGTIKFSVEFYIFCGFLEISISSCFILMLIANVFGLIGFCKCWFNAIFGVNKHILKYIPMDLTIKEFYFFFFSFFFLFFFSFFINFLF